MAETASGMLNCVGLQNKGVDYFCKNIYPTLFPKDGAAEKKPTIIVNVSGSSPEDYAECAARIDELENVPAIELNISCPNVKHGGMAFGTTCAGASSVVKAVRKAYHKTLIVKLSPNVTDITEIARAVEAEGADSVSLINTLMGMAIDIEKYNPNKPSTLKELSLLSIGTGGLSGPCVKPVALRMVYKVAKSVKIPVVGLGGIMCAKDAIEFLMAGATAIEIGTANFIDPAVTIKVRDGINKWLDDHNINDIHDIIGVL
jgi:dihydroorotate dehydrogenase (NAD+) catalytic subunit